MTTLDGLDLGDPCAVWPKLDEILVRLLAGDGLVRARFGDDEQEFQRADIAELRRERDRRKAECEARATKQRHRRRAITFR